MSLPRLLFTVRRLTVAVGAVAAICYVLTLLTPAGAAHLERERCRGNLGQIATALCAYTSQTGTFPSGTIGPEVMPPERRLGWVTAVYKQTDAYQGITFLFWADRPWDSRENTRPQVRLDPVMGRVSVIDSKDPPPFPWGCRANPNKAKPGMPSTLDYVGVAGLGTDSPSLPIGHPRAGVFGYDRRTRPWEIKDGASTTIMLAETAPGNGPWTAGGQATVRGLDPARTPYIGRGRQFGGAHRGGAMGAFADGSVRFLSETIDPRVFEALSTVAGGEPLPAGWDR